MAARDDGLAKLLRATSSWYDPGPGVSCALALKRAVRAEKACRPRDGPGLARMPVAAAVSYAPGPGERLPRPAARFVSFTNSDLRADDDPNGTMFDCACLKPAHA